MITGGLLAGAVTAAIAIGAPPVPLLNVAANAIGAAPVSLVEVAATRAVVATSPTALC
jgi:hypothetical protein